MSRELAINTKELDEEFKIRLTEIQPYVTALKWTNYEIQLCKEWLHKLIKTEKPDKMLRNAYLAKLKKQIINGKLNEPFNKFPQENESLIPITTYLPMNLNVYYEETGNTQQQVHTLVLNNMLNFPMTHIVHKYEYEYTGDIVMSNKCTIEEIKMNDDFNSTEKPNVKDISDIVIRDHEITSIDNKESGDGLKLNLETKIRLESIEEMYKKLKIKNELLTDQVQLYADRKKFSNDYDITVINTNLDKVKNEMNKLCHRMNNIGKSKVTEELQDIKNVKILIDKKCTTIADRMCKIILEIKKLKTTVDIACENKKIANDSLELLEYMKTNFANMTETQYTFRDKINKLENTIDQLMAYANIKSKEVETLEELIINQNLTIDSYKKSIKRIEK